jgi:hypothetical protein
MQARSRHRRDDDPRQHRGTHPHGRAERPVVQRRLDADEPREVAEPGEEHREVRNRERGERRAVWQRRWRDAAAHAAAAAAAWAAVNLPVALAAPEGWWRFFAFNRGRRADWDSLWYLAEQVRGAGFEVATVNLWSAAAFLSGGVVIAAVGARSREAARWWELLLPLLCWFLLTNKVYSPQFSLWLLPLLAAASPAGAPLAAFAVADLAVELGLAGIVAEVDRSTLLLKSVRVCTADAIPRKACQESQCSTRQSAA